MQTESCAAHVSPGSAEGTPSQEGAPRVGGTPRPAGRRPGRPEPVVSLSSRPWLLLAAAVDQTASCPARAVAVCGTAALLSLPSPRLKGIDTCVHGDAGVTLPYDEGLSPQATQGPSGEPRSRSPQSGDIYHPRLPNLPFPRALPWDPNTQTHGAWPPSSTGRPRGPAPSCPPGQDPAAPACPTPPCCLPSRHLGGTRAPSVLASATALWLLREAHNTGCLKHASAYLLRPLSSTASPHFRWRRPCPFSLRPRHNAQDRRVISSGRVKRGCPSRAPSLVSLPLLAHLHLSPG